MDNRNSIPSSSRTFENNKLFNENEEPNNLTALPEITQAKKNDYESVKNLNLSNETLRKPVSVPNYLDVTSNASNTNKFESSIHTIVPQPNDFAEDLPITRGSISNQFPSLMAISQRWSFQSLQEQEQFLQAARKDIYPHLPIPPPPPPLELPPSETDTLNKNELYESAQQLKRNYDFLFREESQLALLISQGLVSPANTTSLSSTHTQLTDTLGQSFIDNQSKKRRKHNNLLKQSQAELSKLKAIVAKQSGIKSIDVQLSKLCLDSQLPETQFNSQHQPYVESLCSETEESGITNDRGPFNPSSNEQCINEPFYNQQTGPECAQKFYPKATGIAGFYVRPLYTQDKIDIPIDIMSKSFDIEELQHHLRNNYFYTDWLQNQSCTPGDSVTKLFSDDQYNGSGDQHSFSGPYEQFCMRSAESAQLLNPKPTQTTQSSATTPQMFTFHNAPNYSEPAHYDQMMPHYAMPAPSYGPFQNNLPNEFPCSTNFSEGQSTPESFQMFNSPSGSWQENVNCPTSTHLHVLPASAPNIMNYCQNEQVPVPGEVFPAQLPVAGYYMPPPNTFGNTRPN